MLLVYTADCRLLHQVNFVFSGTFCLWLITGLMISTCMSCTSTRASADIQERNPKSSSVCSGRNRRPGSESWKTDVDRRVHTFCPKDVARTHLGLHYSYRGWSKLNLVINFLTFPTIHMGRGWPRWTLLSTLLHLPSFHNVLTLSFTPNWNNVHSERSYTRSLYLPPNSPVASILNTINHSRRPPDIFL